MEVESQNDLIAVITGIREKWRTYAKIIVVLPTIVVMASYFITPEYRASALLVTTEDAQSQGLGQLLSSRMGSLSGLAGMAGLGKQPSIEKNLALMRSKAFLSDFIQDEDLMPSLYPDKWDSEANQWIGPSSYQKLKFNIKKLILSVLDSERAAQMELSSKPSLLKAVAVFRRKLHVTLNDQTGLVSVSVVWSDPKTPATIVNSLVKGVNERIRDRKIAEAQKTLSYLQVELENAKLEGIRDGIVSLMTLQLNEKMMASISSDFAFAVIDPAVPPLSKSWPVRSFFALLTVVLSIVGIFAFELFRVSAQNSE